jgi:hypothetical protein
MPKFSHNVLKLLFVAATCYAMYKELQAVAIAAMVGVLLTFGWRQIKLLRDALIPMVASAKRAKISGFEVELRDPTSEISKVLTTQPSWVRYVLSELQPKNLGVLFLLKDKGKYVFPGALRDSLTPLRNAGLVEHNAEALRDSNTAWLSPLGADLVSRLLDPNVAKALALVPADEP